MSLTAVAVLLGAVTLWMVAAAAFAFVDAIRGGSDLGDLGRQGALVFGVAFLVVSLPFGWGARTLWRQRR